MINRFKKNDSLNAPIERIKLSLATQEDVTT